VRGIVKLRVTLDETGRVAGVKPIEGNPLLTRLSEDAIRKCTFAPTVVAGKPVAVTGILTVAFPPRRQP
jgi:outer membrane biosynthesis protein TonB